MIKNSDFYDKESVAYSSKRYPVSISSYVQFFFKKRLAVTIAALRRILGNSSNESLLEIGCADGIVLREIQKQMPDIFSKMIGIDTAENMINVARKLDVSGVATFYVRGQEPQNVLYDVIIEIGVANYTDFDTELMYACDHLKEGGVYILSIAGDNSLSGYMGGDVGYENFLSYCEYEDRIEKFFMIEKVIPVGLRLPLLWKVPVLARAIQELLEVISRPFFGHLFHEKVYVLRKY